jgi:hypothetical protein
MIEALRVLPEITRYFDSFVASACRSELCPPPPAATSRSPKAFSNGSQACGFCAKAAPAMNSGTAKPGNGPHCDAFTTVPTHRAQSDFGQFFSRYASQPRAILTVQHLSE